MNLTERFTLQGQTAVITGGSGVPGSAMARTLASAGANVTLLGRHEERARAAAQAMQTEGGQVIGLGCDVLDRTSLKHARQQIHERFGPIDILVNAAGGNSPRATTTPELSFFDLESAAIEQVFGLNFTETLLSCQVFGRELAERGQGCIVTIASMNALRPLTRIPAYSAAKAAIVNFTQWLAVHLAKEYSAGIRVNAIAPGFFLTEQNRFLMLAAQGGLTQRGQTILAHTPMGRFGTPEDLAGTLLWLVSPASAFVTGIVVPVDGGFSAYSGI